jgi:membrane protease YdiL (CAAX protease family)
MIPFIAALPVLTRFMISLSAGFVEESFFRGFLQPRIGILASTALFAMAHLSYDQPLMLIGITLLSLFYGALVKWRQNVIAAVVAHFLFDAIQLLIVIPAVLKLVYADGAAR